MPSLLVEKHHDAVNIADALGRWASETPFAPAIVDDDRILHYRDLDRAVWRAASRFVADGTRPGDRIGISLAGNSALYLVVVYGLARMGAVGMLLPVREPPSVRMALARRFRLAAGVADDDAARVDGLPLLKPSENWLAPGQAPVDPEVRFGGGAAPWMIFFSSGTTAAPKAMERSHADHIPLFEIGRRQIVGPGGRFLTLTAFEFSFGLSHAMQTLDGGGTVRIVALPIAIDALSRIIDREDITHLAITPTFARDLLAHFPGEKPRFPGLRNLALCTMAAPETLRREIRRRLTPNLVIYYGTNEAWYLTSADAATQVALPETVGLPHDGVEIQIVDDCDRTLPAGEVGLIRLHAPGLPAGYIDNPEATAKAFRDGWYYPGDLGVLAPEGALFLKGRADDMINYDGVKIYPADIEAALLRHPAVIEAAAFAVTVDGYRQTPVAAVVLRAATPSEDLVAFCQQQLGARAPRGVYAFRALPRTAIGKVLKRELARQLTQSLSSPARSG